MNKQTDFFYQKLNVRTHTHYTRIKFLLFLLCFSLMNLTTLFAQCNGTYDFSYPNTTTITGEGLTSGDWDYSDVYIENVMYINDDFDAEHTNFFMGDNATIQIQNGIEFKLLECHFVACAGVPWGNIIVTQNSTLHLDKCIIEDANFAVHAIGNGVELKIVNNEFLNNEVGINIGDIVNTSLWPLTMTFNGHIYNNKFENNNANNNAYGIRIFHTMFTNNELRIGDIGQENFFIGLDKGIHIEECSKIRIKANDFDDIISRGIEVEDQMFLKIFENNFNAQNIPTTTAIWGRNVDATINGNSIDNAIGGISMIQGGLNSMYMTGNTISNTETCINLQNYGTSGAVANFVQVDLNTLNLDNERSIGISLTDMEAEQVIEDNNLFITEADAAFGVIATDCRNIELLDNDFEMSAITANPTIGSFEAISFNDTESCALVANTLYRVATSNQTATIGININTCQNMLYCCNDLNHAETGFFMEGSCGNNRIHNTMFRDHHTGLYLFFPGVTQGISNQNNTGNDWTNNAVSRTWDARINTFDPFVISGSRFFVHQNNLPNMLNKINVNGSVILINNPWFFINTNNDPDCVYTSTNYCNDAFFPAKNEQNEIQELSSGDFAIAQGQEYTDAISQGLYWTEQQFLYQKLVENPLLLLEDIAINNFYENAQLSCLASFDFIERAITAMYLPAEEDLAIYTELWTNSHQLSDQLDALYLQMETASPEEMDGFLFQQNNLITDLNEVMTALYTMNNQIKIDRFNTADLLLEQNTVIVTNEVYEQNIKTCNNIYLNTIAKDIFEFTEEQKQEIIAIADQCSLSGGRGVLMARSLRAMFEQVQYDDRNLCDWEAEDRIEKDNLAQNQEPKFNVYPNPTKNQITISLNKILEEETTLLITNILGNQILTKQMEIGSSNHFVDVQSFSSGIYMVHISSKDKSIDYSTKITILK